MLKLESTAADGGDNWFPSRNQRDWMMCDACDRAPAAFLCKADAASLCAACDSDIHSANPLARRHHRVPIPGNLYGGAAPGLTMGPPEEDPEDDFLTQDDREDEDEAASWLLLNPVKNGDGNAPAMFAGGVVDEYLDLEEFNSCQNNEFSCDQYSNPQQHYNLGDDSVVPIRYHERKDRIQGQCFQLGLEYEDLKTGFSYRASMSHNVSLSPVDVGVVPESTMSEGSIMSHTRPPKGTIDLFSGPLIMQTPVVPTQLSPMDREARVLRYREKKKMRKFEKTIRYASRKAYAETRPRIKGRFAKRISCTS